METPSLAEILKNLDTEIERDNSPKQVTLRKALAKLDAEIKNGRA